MGHLRCLVTPAQAPTARLENLLVPGVSLENLAQAPTARLENLAQAPTARRASLLVPEVCPESSSRVSAGQVGFEVRALT